MNNNYKEIINSFNSLKDVSYPCLNAISKKNFSTQDLAQIYATLVPVILKIECAKDIMEKLPLLKDVEVSEIMDNYMRVPENFEYYSMSNFHFWSEKEANALIYSEVAFHLVGISEALVDICFLNIQQVPEEILTEIIFDAIHTFVTNISYNGKEAIELIENSKLLPQKK